MRWRTGENASITRQCPQIIVGALAFIVVLTGCTTGPVEFSCMAMNRAPTTPGAEVRTDHFSVMQPGAGWCVMEKRPSLVGFSTHPLLGKTVERSTLALPKYRYTTYALSAFSVDLGDREVDTYAKFVDLMEGWVARGMTIDSDGSTILFSDTTPPPSRIRHVEGSVEAKDVPDHAWCVTYLKSGEERGNRVSPNVVFRSRERGRLCLDPSSRDHVVVMELSERANQEVRLDDGWFESLYEGDALAFFDSLRFPK